MVSLEGSWPVVNVDEHWALLQTGMYIKKNNTIQPVKKNMKCTHILHTQTIEDWFDRFPNTAAYFGCAVHSVLFRHTQVLFTET